MLRISLAGLVLAVAFTSAAHAGARVAEPRVVRAARGHRGAFEVARMAAALSPVVPIQHEGRGWIPFQLTTARKRVAAYKEPDGSAVIVVENQSHGRARTWVFDAAGKTPLAVHLMKPAEGGSKIGYKSIVGPALDGYMRKVLQRGSR